MPFGRMIAFLLVVPFSLFLKKKDGKTWHNGIKWLSLH